MYTDIDPVRAHARDELGIDIDNLPDARQAAVVSFVRLTLNCSPNSFQYRKPLCMLVSTYSICKQINLSERCFAMTVAPFQCARYMQVYFISGALLPTLALLLPDRFKFWGVVTAVTVALAAFGAIASSVGGTSMLLGSTRLVVGGWIAMLCTAAVGYLFMEDSPGEAKLLGGI